eukprot:251503-Prymnesium_polylepis.1
MAGAPPSRLPSGSSSLATPHSSPSYAAAQARAVHRLEGRQRVDGRRLVHEHRDADGRRLGRHDRQVLLQPARKKVPL